MCKWKIEPGPYAENLTLAFTSFDLEENKDYLKVYALPTNQLIANFTGSTIPEPLVSPTGRMLLLFTSNGFNNKGGFDAEYYILNVSASANEFTGNLSVIQTLRKDTQKLNSVLLKPPALFLDFTI